MKRILFACCMLTAALGSKAAVAEGLLAKENFSATLTLTTDYIYRGTSFSDENPAIQGSMDWAHELANGGYLFAGVWGSNIDGSAYGYNAELDFYAGYGNSLAGLDFWIQPIYYYFPGGSNADGELNFFEVWANVSHSFESAGAPTISLLYAISPNWSYNSRGVAHYLRPSVAFSLPQGFGVDFGVGYQYLDGKGSGNSSINYTHWDAGVSKSILGFDLDLRYHDTNGEKDDDYGSYLGGDDLIDSRVVFSVARSF